MANHINIHGNTAEAGATQVNNMSMNTTYTIHEIDRLCLRALQCPPDSLIVKNRLKETKDKLHLESIKWVFQSQDFRRWRDKDDSGLLWIKGGPGKGKTMMSIGIIERLLDQRENPPLVTYFFCQNGDNELNTLGSILKALILRLFNQNKGLKECLRRHWDTQNSRFEKDLTSWRNLWDILQEILDKCGNQKVYIIIDALDECQEDGISKFLTTLVRTGLHHPSRIKWLLTSRPFNDERILLTADDQRQLNLEVNLDHVKGAIKSYISFKMRELDRLWELEPEVRDNIEAQLNQKADGTYLWVSLACKKLEDVRPKAVLEEVQTLLPGLQSFYHEALIQISRRGSKSLRILKVLSLAYRPLHIQELESVTGLAQQDIDIERLLSECESFINLRNDYLEFSHQSARDYLGGGKASAILKPYKSYGHEKIALNCVSYLSRELKVNLLDIKLPASTLDDLDESLRHLQLAKVNYAAHFWAQHVEKARNTIDIQRSLGENGAVSKFVQSRILEWLECLSWLDSTSLALDEMHRVMTIAKAKSPLLAFLQDATRFLQRHSHIISHWPLQTYSSALIFSPKESLVRQMNISKVPKWLKDPPFLGESWSSLIRTLEGHADFVTAVAFSHDGQSIASLSGDRTIKLWDVRTGGLQRTIQKDPSSWNDGVLFSPDDKLISSYSPLSLAHIWSIASGKLQMKFETQADDAAFSSDGKHLLTIKNSGEISVLEVSTGKIVHRVASRYDTSKAALSPNGKYMALGFSSGDIRICTMDGDVLSILAGLDQLSHLIFSPDSKYIGSWDINGAIKVWNIETGDLHHSVRGYLLSGYLSLATSFALSPSGRHAVLGCDNGDLHLWDLISGTLQKILHGHTNRTAVLSFSPDGEYVASGSYDKTIKLWAVAGDVEQTRNAPQVLFVSTNGNSAVALCQENNSLVLRDSAKVLSSWGDLQDFMITTVSLDRRFVAWSERGKVYLYNTTEDSSITLEGHEWSFVSSLSFSPNGYYFASSSGKEGLKLWTTEGNLIRKLESPDFNGEWAEAISFSADGKYLAASFEKKIILWDVPELLGAPRLFSFGGPRSDFPQTITLQHYVKVLKFSSDGRSLLTDQGLISLDDILPANQKTTSTSSLGDLWVGDRWIYFGESPVLRLPSDLYRTPYDARDGHIVISSRDNQVLEFHIDRVSLKQALKK
ncbi:hypothetical protein ASPZODRAFT_169522 [Penicilliopsis zonata CBS 506.65]|uniref:NACHT domain-containing protein n=1 Tax=Penicilliopsis zonata CBS 506.65 TaxID=1073090 RepID=A0A1L9S7S4_9EURO|nr:hypothetical protein ASPZODRAFT_169522 [Penicilliopsis zonata CBS 506.65]OJJ43208.1 hypothetical protein ASPZODRAFT_169522 [Penicilliopsis zonata CBS 506.65]